MKGIIFTEFLAFVEDRHGDDFVDDLIFHAKLPGKGVYTSVGTYEFSELAKLLGLYCQSTDSKVPDVLRLFGTYLVGAFYRKWPDIFSRYGGTIELLNQVEDNIHVEVKKLYPDAQLPTFRTIEIGKNSIVVDYASCRSLSDLATGLISGVAGHYRENVEILTDNVASADKPTVRFRVEIRS